MERFAQSPGHPGRRGSLWANVGGGVVDRTERSPGSQPAPLTSIFTGVDRLAPKGGARPVQVSKDGVPALWAKAPQRSMSACCGDKPAASCGGTPPLFVGTSQKGAPTHRVASPARMEADRTAAPRKVSAAWFAEVVRLEPAQVAALEGDEVTLDEEAWGAVQAILTARAEARSTRKKVEKRRAKIWPRDATQSARAQEAKGDLQGGRGLGPIENPVHPCECSSEVLVHPPLRFVDSSLGSDRQSGGWEIKDGRPVIRPWKSLRMVEKWLNEDMYEGEDPSTCVVNAEVYFRKSRTWDGSEEPVLSYDLVPLDWADPAPNADNDQAILTIRGVKGMEAGDLLLTAYPRGDDGLAERDPLIDGVIQTNPYNEPQYNDSRFGIVLHGCCNVVVSHLRIRGFNTGILLLGASRRHVYSNLHVYDHARNGFRMGLTASEVEGLGGTMVQKVNTAIAMGIYPEDITITGCTFSSNGYDTAGGDIAMNFLSTNCNILNNTLKGDDADTGPRGVDGIGSQCASSGHLIEGNRISTHRMWCDGTRMISGGSGSGCSSSPATCPDIPRLEEACGTTTGCTSGTAYGYSIRPTSPGSSCDAAFGEDGIDLKGVRRRTPTAKAETIICGNVIWGHSNFTGIGIADGAQNIHIFRNRIFQNNAGIGITNGTNSGWFHEYEPDYLTKKTQDIYIYRNQIYMNRGMGILIKSSVTEDAGGTEIPLRVAGIYMVNNTIAHNLLTGVNVAIRSWSSTSGTEVDDIHLVNNLIARNGIGGVGYPYSDGMQVYWDGAMDLLSGGYVSTHNCYLGWSRAAGSALEDVIRWGASHQTVSVASVLWGIEDDPVQASSISELDLSGEVEIVTMEGVLPTAGAALEAKVSGEPAYSIEAIDYDIGRDSICFQSGADLSGARQVAVDADVAWSEDFEGGPVTFGVPDIGAYEVNLPPFRTATLERRSK